MNSEMFSEEKKQALGRIVRGSAFLEESMKNHTSFRIGGPADILITPRDEDDLKTIIDFSRENGIPLTIIGNGTKLLVSDEGIRGVVIKISGCLNDLIISGTKVKVGAGYSVSKLSSVLADHGLSGLEFAIGIPGAVGGAVVMNAEAHGAAMSDVVTNVVVMDFEGRVTEHRKDELGFGYRQSLLQDGGYVVVTVNMELAKGDPREINNRMSDYIQWRRSNQPMGLPNAGSIFKAHLPNGLVAGKLIDEAGLKGVKLGGAQISEKRANFIMNLGNATASDVRQLMQLIETKVFEKYSVRLEPEIRIL